MVTQVNLITVFLASPSDVAEERVIAEGVVSELNLTFGPATNSQFRLLRWETDTAPAAGSDVQSSINSQIGDEFDILVGIFWGRVGTPTPKAKSGTVEEIERALDRRQRDPSSVDVMIYFKEQGISPSQVDVDQMRALQELKPILSSRGVYYKTFKDTDSFETAFRVELQLTAKRILSTTNKFATSDTPRVAIDHSAAIQDEVSGGYLDLEEASTLASREMVETLDLINNTMQRFTAVTEKETKAVQANPDQKNLRAAADTPLSSLRVEMQRSRHLVNCLLRKKAA